MKSPFKFLDSYTKDDRKIFFGRDLEIEELYQRVFDSKLMLVYGVSGTGKSSLIHCGLANKFRETDWLPIVIRHGGNIIESMTAGIRSASITTQQNKFVTPGDFKKAVRSLYLDHYKPVFFIFDQFEELFIFGDKEERRTFIHIVKTLTESDLQCRMIFVMREEYMAGVTEFEKYIPTFFSNRVRIEKMSHTNALEAIKEPCKVFNIRLEKGFAEALLEKLSPGETDVELTYLQVFLDKIFRLAAEFLPPLGGESKGGSSLARVDQGGADEPKEGISFTHALLEKIGNVSDILGSFLEEQLKALDEPDTGLSILKSFVSIKGTKRQLTQQEVIESSRAFGKNIPADKVSDLLQRFVNLRILRDDSLATKIYEKITLVEKELMEVNQFLENALISYQKRKILLSVNDLKYIAPYEDRLFVTKETENLIAQSKREQNKTKKRIKNIAISGLIAALIFSLGSIMMVFHWPLYWLVRRLGIIIYLIWFLPVFGYYVLKTRENKAMNILFLIFTLIFMANIYLFSTYTRNKVKTLLTTSSIHNDQKANEEIGRYSGKADSIYAIIQKLSDEYAGKLNYNNLYYFSGIINLIKTVRERTDELFTYLQDIKIEIITVTEGPGTPAVNGREINISQITKYGESNVPSEILIGFRNNGKAYVISTLIREYKDFLIYAVKQDKGVSSSINQVLNLDDQKMPDADTKTSLLESWEHYTFQSKPIVYVINTLSEIQADVKYCESETMTYLYNKMLAEIKENSVSKQESMRK
jgi:hypothetical protein